MRMRLSEQVFETFCRKEGNQHIATENALHGLDRIICRYGLQNLLELGIGIGTIPYFLNLLAKEKSIKINYTGTEANDYCIRQFGKNLPEDHDYFSFRHFMDLESVPVEKFDLIIVDGTDSHFDSLQKYCDKETVLFVEGDRKAQRKQILQMFGRTAVVRCFSAITNKKNGLQSPFTSTYGGGYSVFFLNPGVQKKLFTLYNKVLTAAKYRVRPFYTKYHDGRDKKRLTIN
jgi:hypothetical protein